MADDFPLINLLAAYELSALQRIVLGILEVHRGGACALPR